MTDTEVLALANAYAAVLPRTRASEDEFVLNKRYLCAFAKAIAAEEREACAALVDQIQEKCIEDDVDDPSLTMVAFAIRNRGESNE